MAADTDLTLRVRVAAYAIVISAGHILLARFVGGADRRWSLPGGGLDHGEDPADAVVREVTEETGYLCQLDELLGIDSHRITFDREPPVDMHGIRVIYEAHIVGGDLRHEVGGSTDRAEWFPLAALPTLARVSLVDRGLELHERRPATGHVDGTSS